MPIQLNDAIERAKLAADDTGMLSPYIYQMILKSLPEGERYYFTLGLVDLGIQTKFASKEDERHMKSVLKRSLRFTNKQLKDVRKESQAAHESGDIGVYLDALSEIGLHINQEGLVSFYNFNIPGVYMDKIPMRPVTMEQAKDILEKKYSTSDKGVDTVTGLLDSVARINTALKNARDSLTEIYNESNNLTELMQNSHYNNRSPDEDIRNAVITLEGLTEYLNGLSENGLDEISRNLMGFEDYINNSFDSLDYLRYTRDEMSIKNYDYSQVLTNLIEIRDSDPEYFYDSVRGMGGIIGKLKRAFLGG